MYFPLEGQNVSQSHSCVPHTSLSSLHFAQSSEAQIHIKRHIMYNCSRQNFPYPGNRLLAIHQGCSQGTIPEFIHGSKEKMIKDPETRDQLSKESCDDRFSLPTRQPPASPGGGSFPVGIVNPASPFPPNFWRLLQSQSDHNSL